MNPHIALTGGTVLLANLPLFTLDGDTFVRMIPQMLNFIIVAAVLTYLLYKPVLKVLDARANRVANDIEAAAADKANAEKLKADYEQKIRDIEKERGVILEEARKQAVVRRDQIVEEAKAEALDIKTRASRDISAERDRVKAEVQQAIIDISADMAAKLVAVTIDKKAHEKLFAEALQELETTAFRPLEHVV